MNTKRRILSRQPIPFQRSQLSPFHLSSFFTSIKSLSIVQVWYYISTLPSFSVSDSSFSLIFRRCSHWWAIDLMLRQLLLSPGTQRGVGDMHSPNRFNCADSGLSSWSVCLVLKWPEPSGWALLYFLHQTYLFCMFLLLIPFYTKMIAWMSVFFLKAVDWPLWPPASGNTCLSGALYLTTWTIMK